MKSSRRLGQAKKRLAKINEEKLENLDDYTTIQDHTLESPNEVSRKLHEKTCVWCMKADNKKNTNDHFRKIEQLNAWNRFKNHTIYIDDEKSYNLY